MAELLKSIDYTFNEEIIDYDPSDELNGGKVNYTETPGDDGGATKWGVSNPVWNQFYGRAVSPMEISKTTKYHGMAVAFSIYWAPYYLSQIANQNLATGLFDTIWGAPGMAATYMQHISYELGQNLTLDNHIGPKTIAAVNACDPNAFLTELSKSVRSRYLSIVSSNPKQEKFLNGWLSRASKLLTLKSPADPGNVS